MKRDLQGENLTIVFPSFMRTCHRKVWVQYVVSTFVLLFYDTSRSGTKVLNTFSEYTRSLLYA